MGQEPQESMPPGGSGTFLFSWLPWTLFLFVLYPLSVGPVAKIIGPRPPMIVHAIYAPLGYLHDHSQPVHSFYDWYAKVWGVHF